jgi:hypothetical protein
LEVEADEEAEAETEEEGVPVFDRAEKPSYEPDAETGESK